MKYTRLNLVADSTTECVEDTSDGTPYSGFVRNQIHLDVKGLELGGEFELGDYTSVFNDDHVLVGFPVTAGDGLYLVVVRYTDGGTFGSTEGYHFLAGAFETKAEAEERVRAIESNHWNPGYAPWRGYFAKLDSVDCESVQVRPAGR